MHMSKNNTETVSKFVVQKKSARQTTNVYIEIRQRSL